MNLLSHFACARHLAPLEQGGSALGDLLPLYRRRARPLALVKHWSREAEAGSPEAGIARGVRFHLHVDSRFHKDALFLESAAAIQAALLGANAAPGLKRFFPAHILTEMFLDHLLMREHPELPEAFYVLLGGPHADALAAFSAAHPEMEAEREAFAAFLRRVAADRFLEDYRDADGMLRRMQRMLRRFGQRGLERAEEAAVRGAFEALRVTARPALLQFVAAMRDAEWDPAGAGPAIAPADAPRKERLAKPAP